MSLLYTVTFEQKCLNVLLQATNYYMVIFVYRNMLLNICI